VSVENLIESMNQRGWAVVTNCMEHTDSLRLKSACELACQKGEFRPAGVGRGDERTIREDIRQDQVLWLDPHGNSLGQVILSHHARAGWSVFSLENSGIR